MEVSLHTTKLIKRRIKNIVNNYSNVEALTREATSNDSWGPQSQILTQLAEESYNPQHKDKIMSILWKRLTDSSKNWRHISKSLTVIEHLIKVGNTDIYNECIAQKAVFQSLSEYIVNTNIKADENFQKKIRNKASDILNLLNDDTTYIMESTKAKIIEERLKNDCSLSSDNQAEKSTSLFDDNSVVKLEPPLEPLKKKVELKKDSHSNDIFEELKNLDWSTGLNQPSNKNGFGNENFYNKYTDLSGYFPVTTQRQTDSDIDFFEVNFAQEPKKNVDTSNLDPFSDPFTTLVPESKPNSCQSQDFNQNLVGIDFWSSNPTKVCVPSADPFADRENKSNQVKENEGDQKKKIVDLNYGAMKFLGDHKNLVDIESLILPINTPVKAQSNAFDKKDSNHPFGEPFSPKQAVALRDMVNDNDLFLSNSLVQSNQNVQTPNEATKSAQSNAWSSNPFL